MAAGGCTSHAQDDAEEEESALSATVTAGVLSFVSTALLMPAALVVLRRLDTVDHPNARSSHATPTLRGGGLAPLVACLIAAVAVPYLDGRVRLAFLLAAVGFGAIGLTEDLHGLSAARRFVAQLVVAGAVAFALWPLLDRAGIAAWLVPVAVFWLAAYVNAFNFMDGINGISGAQALAAGGGFIFMGRLVDAPQLMVASAVIGAAALAFLPYNFPRARVFLGDVGSYFFGGWLALTAMLALLSGVPVEAAAAPLLIYLGDTGTTLIKRALRREAWHQPHRTHVYQRLTQRGWSHARTTGFVAAAIVACTSLGLVSVGASALTRVGAVCGMLAVLVVYLTSPVLLEQLRSRQLART